MIYIQNGGLLLLPVVFVPSSSLLITEVAQHSQFQFYAKTIFLQTMLVLYW